METGYILLVEDNPDDQALTLRALQKAGVGCEVVVVRDGVEALDFLFGTAEQAGNSPENLPQLLMLDLKLPKVDGLEVLRTIRQEERTRCLPVVVFTSSNEEQDICDSYALGVNSYIRKPVDFHEFSDAVRQLGIYWLSLNIGPRRYSSGR